MSVSSALGCSIDWEHRFDVQGPLYMQVSRGSLVLHLSEHHGDGTPGQVVYVAATGVRDLHAELQTKDYSFLSRGIGASPASPHDGTGRQHTPFGYRDGRGKPLGSHRDQVGGLATVDHMPPAPELWWAIVSPAAAS